MELTQSHRRAEETMADFKYYLRVRYSECDGQKVVYNARYGDYVGLAMHEYLRLTGLSREFEARRLGFQLVKQTLEWKASVRFDQVLELSLRVTHVGTTSFTAVTEFRVANEDRVRVVAETVHVLIDETAMRKVPLTQRQRHSLLCGTAGAEVDHAGHLARVCCNACVYDSPQCM